MKQHLFSGCGTALITPFDSETGRLDLLFFERLIRFQIQNGTDALIVAGTTGESPVLTGEEKSLLFETAVSAAGGRTPVIAGTGSNDTGRAVKNCNEAEKKGVDGLLIVTPFYNKCTQEGLVRHYTYIADRVSAPIIVYNVPSRTCVNILPETYKALAEHKHIVAVKEANGDISSVAKTRALCGESLDVYSGNDDQTAAIMALGGKGVISVASNIIPKQMRELTRAALNGDCETAAAIQRQYQRLMNLLFCEVNPIPVKAAAEMMFARKLPLRLPLTRLTEPNRLKLRDEMKALKLLDNENLLC
ncbi:MAG: 4-hydroxy-tetrahydrodipicolinate synthase [Clostridia bacterium]|nr:4-hydroxy-tetrahydrodipicolinate synthase [Clostridia bacterium]